MATARAAWAIFCAISVRFTAVALEYSNPAFCETTLAAPKINGLARGPAFHVLSSFDFPFSPGSKIRRKAGPASHPAEVSICR